MKASFARRALVLLGLSAAALAAADKYDGPRPPKPDTPYLLHAANLIPTEELEAGEETKKDDTTYHAPGVNSTARTPLAEPIFLLESKSLPPEKLELYKMEVKNGRREIKFSKKAKDNPRPVHVLITRLADGLYRIEANEPLENGQYSLTPSGSNKVFLFEVY